MPSIRVTTLGEGGVNVDKNPLRTEDNELLSCQNATYDGTRQRLGGLSKRPGLDRFNTVPMGGIVLGGIEAPYKGTASAPTSGGGGGGAPGDSGGTGPPAGGDGVGPGDSAGGGSVDGGSVGGGLFNGGRRIFGGRRIVIIGRILNSAASAGWYMTSEGFQDAAWRLNSGTETTAGPPQGPHNVNFPNGANASGGGNELSAMTIANGRLYYAEDVWNQTAAVSPTLPRLRVLEADGSGDKVMLTVPDNPAILALGTIPSHLTTVTAMMTEWGNGDAIYVATYDLVSTGASAGDYGRILRVSGLDAGSYAVQEVYNFFTNPLGLATGSVPRVLEAFLGRTWVGMWHGVNTSDPQITRIVPTDTDPTPTWGIDKTNTVTTVASAADITCLRAYSGKLYFGITTRDPTVGFATLYSLTPDDAVTLELTGSGGTAISPSGFVSAELFGGNLYVSYFANTQASKIYQFDGTTWTAVYTASTATEKAVQLVLRADGDYLYAYGGDVLSSTINDWLVTSDGTTWTTKRTSFVGNLGHGDFSTSAPVNILFGIDQ